MDGLEGNGGLRDEAVEDLEKDERYSRNGVDDIMCFSSFTAIFFEDDEKRLKRGGEDENELRVKLEGEPERRKKEEGALPVLGETRTRKENANPAEIRGWQAN